MNNKLQNFNEFLNESENITDSKIGLKPIDYRQAKKFNPKDFESINDYFLDEASKNSSYSGSVNMLNNFYEHIQFFILHNHLGFYYKSEPNNLFIMFKTSEPPKTITRANSLKFSNREHDYFIEKTDIDETSFNLWAFDKKKYYIVGSLDGDDWDTWKITNTVSYDKEDIKDEIESPLLPIDFDVATDLLYPLESIANIKQFAKLKFNN